MARTKATVRQENANLVSNPAICINFATIKLRFLVRQAAARAVKRNKWSTSDSDKSDSEKSDISEYKMSDIESEISEEHSDSNASSDFNPFNSDSDSDNDPWSRKKKGKKQKKKTKKRTSTQDKLSLLIAQKTTKSKLNYSLFANCKFEACSCLFSYCKRHL